MFGLGFGEIIAIGVVIFIFFGAKRLPQLGGDMAKGIRNFQKGLKGEDEDTSGNIENKSDSSESNDSKNSKGDTPG